MLQNVLVAAQGEPMSTKEPMSILQALFPSLSTSPDNVSVLFKQWMRMLDGLSPVEAPIDIRLASETRLSVSADPHYGDEQGFLPCFVKAETMRKSNAGSVQVYQVGRLHTASSTVRLLEPAQFVVIKVFEMQKAAQVQENPMNEIALHSRIVADSKMADGVIPLLGCLATPERLFVVFPLCPEGDMFKFLSESSDKLSERQIRVIMRGMLKGLEQSHDNFVCHRDISLENYLKHGNELALIDFGLSVEMDALNYSVPNTGPVGKTKYMAPELAMGNTDKADGRKLDVWSLGVTLFMLITKTEPFHVALNVDERYRLMVTKKGMRGVFKSWGVVVSNPLMDLLEAMLNPDANLRPTVQEINTHPWMVEA